ncbi:Type I restriction modification DNA specificity domain [Bartonella apihabitans]|uniref:restriction endonuclease subunit S n=1 Tax=Bartonella apihabitans TaxID=2750929 RepID=UPI00399802C6
MDDWKEVTLADIADIVPGFAFKGKDFGTVGQSVIKIKDIIPPIIDILHTNKIDIKKYNKHKIDKYKIKKNDFVVAMTGATIGKVGVLTKEIEAYVNQRVAIIKPHDNISKEFVYYTTQITEFYNHIKNNIDSNSAQENISGNSIGKYIIYIPSLDYQNRIVDILSSLDHKIELNRQVNETLEQMAQAVFQDWFVDFGPVKRKLEGINDPVAILGGLIPDPIKAQEIANLFPDQFADNGLPEGWEVKGLDQVADFLNGLALQKFPALHNDDFLPVIKIAELRNGVSANSGKANTNIPEKFIIDDKDFIFSWSGSLLAKFWTEGKGALNQHLFKVTSTEYPHWFFSQWVYHYLKDFQQIAAAKATTMGHIQRKHLSSALVNCPSHGDIKRFGLVLSPITDLIISNNIQNHTLAEMRDLLLPKLMSGEISVDELEKKMGRVL